MATSRHASIDYTEQCTVCIDYEDSGVVSRLTYERPQMQIPNRPLTSAERAQILQYPNDEALSSEAEWIFSDMKSKSRISKSAMLVSVFIARSAAAALEMNL